MLETGSGMYGLVNKGIEQFIVARYGAPAWRRVAERAGEVPEVFISMEAYPDSLSYAIVGAAAEELSLGAAELLEAFGEYWVLYTAEQGYGELLEAAGDNLLEFLGNLDSLHARVALTYADLKPPSFKLVPAGERSVDVHYHTSRDGLAPMMIGLLKGLSRRFAEPIEIEQTAARSHGAPHDVFRVTWV
jgi:hypothetical protein